MAAAVRAALERFATQQGISPEDVRTLPKVSLIGCCPPLEKLDGAFGQNLGPNCRQLSISTNNIDRLTGLTGLDGLEILSAGRNCIKRLDGIEAVAATLQELWVSYNTLEKLAGAERCPNLRVLYASNNKIKDWAEVERLAPLEHLDDLLLVGNPLCGDDAKAYRTGVLQRLPRLKKLDGQLVTDDERNAAKESA